MDMYSESVERCWKDFRPCNNLFLLQAKLKKMKALFKQKFVKVTVGLDKRVDDARENLLNFQMAVHNNPSDSALLLQEFEASTEFWKLKRYQMIFYQQRTKIQWAKEGDINSKFFSQHFKGQEKHEQY
ncbi:hypothetical protein QQ045_032037 [Rhodiola kirilowii]